MVIHCGLTELLGEVTLTKRSFPANHNQKTSAATIDVLFADVAVANPFEGWQELDFLTGTIPATNSLSDSVQLHFKGGFLRTEFAHRLRGRVINTRDGGVVTIEIPAGITLEDGSQISVKNVLARTTGKAVGAQITATVQCQPPESSLFVNGTTCSVALCGLYLQLATQPAQINSNEQVAHPVLYLEEALVNESNLEPRKGVRVHFVLSDLAEHVSIVWPEIGVETRYGNSQLQKISASNNDAVYEFMWNKNDQTADQIRLFRLDLEARLNVPIRGGTCTVQCQLYPPGISPLIPRFEHPLLPDPGCYLLRFL
ncbi:MAG: hypothetical protein AB1898_17960 [Acidobacteriota bacterium]